MNVDELKHKAALRAVEYVRDGMDVGLGTGSTAEHAVREIGRRVREEGLRVRCVSTSDTISRLAADVGISVVTLEECPQLDVTIDGADEIVLGTLDAIKGMGGALLYEKIVALATREEILIVDGSKVVERLGDHTSVPVEIVRWGWTSTRDALRGLGCEPVLRVGDDSTPFVTDSGHLIVDCRFPPMEDARPVAEAIKQITGVVEHGLFLGIARRAIVARPDGLQVVDRASHSL
jgi:ribose 5-phosphate isomerase A